jgi:hypothetical protein
MVPKSMYKVSFAGLTALSHELKLLNTEIDIGSLA